MSTPSTLFAQLQLAEATYALFDGMPFKNEVELRRCLLDEGFSAALANEFVAHWQVINYQGNTASGFSATLFESLDNPGQLTLAFRGTRME
jgi:hypothetical protein